MIPLRLIEKLRYGRAVEHTRIEHPPIFVIGHARSGTTHLQYLLTRDPIFGTVSTLQSMVPTFFLIGRGWIKRQLEKQLMPRRPQDDVRMSMDFPNEEEFAISNSSAISAVHTFTFPSRGMEIFEKNLLMKGLSQEEQAHWDQVFTDIIRKATLHCGGKQLVLKSTTSTGRIRHLLCLYPDARFIHIVRNPCDVYYSTKYLYKKMFELFLLEDNPGDFSDFVVHGYQTIMTQFLEDREAIPEGHLVELRYEDLVTDPMLELERIYTRLGLEGWEDRARPPIAEYLATLSGYRRNRFEEDEEAMRLISREWKFAFDEWGYDPPFES